MEEAPEEHNVSSADYWSARYQKGDNPWDLGRETPVFAALRLQPDIPSPSDSYAPTVVIPGCGFGHDALAYAESGYEVTAVDFAPEPLEYLRSQARLLQVQLHTLERDIFNLPSERTAAYDLCLEYTCYCAIEPERRQEYVNVLAAIMKPQGIVAGLFFPMDEVERTAPPYTVYEQEIREQFEQAGFVLIRNEIPAESHPARAGRERLMLFRYNR